jgi:hypothetical protein
MFNLFSEFTKDHHKPDGKENTDQFKNLPKKKAADPKGKDLFLSRGPDGVKKSQPLTSSSAFLMGTYNDMKDHDLALREVQPEPKKVVVDNKSFGGLVNKFADHETPNVMHPETKIRFADQILSSPKKKDGKKGRKGAKGKKGLQANEEPLTLEQKAEAEKSGLNYNPNQFKKGKGGGQNFQRMELKGKGQYRDKLSGTAQYYKTKFLPNGRQKSFYKDRNTEINAPFAIREDAEESEGEYEIENGEKKAVIKTENLLQSRDAIISKGNVFYSLLNKATKLFLINASNVPESVMVKIQETKNMIKDLESKGPETFKTSLQRIWGFEDFFDFQS